MVTFKLHLYFPGWVGVGGWVVIIKLKANLSSNWTGLGLDLDWTGTELGNTFTVNSKKYFIRANSLELLLKHYSEKYFIRPTSLD